MLASCLRTYIQFALTGAVRAFVISTSSRSLATVSISDSRYHQISTDWVSVAVPGGCYSQSYHRYLSALFNAHILAPPPLGHVQVGE